MQEPEFDPQIERLFAQAPHLPDSDAFARRIEGKLAKSWRVRTWALGAAGVVGGAVAVAQTLGSGLSVQMAQAQEASAQRVDALIGQTVSQSEAVARDYVGMFDFAANPTVFWVACGMIVLAAGSLAARLFDEA